MAAEEERGLALRSSAMDIEQDLWSEGWSGLPPELLEMIGSNLTEGAHVHNAAMVCKSWNASIATGLTGMEVDMHSDPSMWRAKIEKLQSLIRQLRCVVIHVNAAISDEMLFHNIALVQQLKSVSELKLHLREGCDLPPAAAAAIGAMPHLTSLSIVGGGLKPEAALGLLSALASNAAAAAAGGAGAGAIPGAAACSGDGGSDGGSDGGGGRPCGLRSLTLLPAVPYGLGDGEMTLLSACCSLEVLEFRAYRLTSAGLATLSLGLPRLTRLAITSLDSDSGYELACLERLAQLAELDLALDNAPVGLASRRALCMLRPGRSLSLSFRWTDRAQGLLTEYGNRLSNLTHLDVGACRVGSESLFEAVAQLTGLRQLRMAVYSNADHCIPCHLSQLSALSALQRFHLEKRRAYFPEARRFGESSIAVPVTAEGLRCLAGRWCRLRSLRLALSRKDYSPEALSVLSSFTGLRELGILVERYPTGGVGGGGGGGGGGQQPSPQQQQQPQQSAQQQQQTQQRLQEQDQPAATSPGTSPGLGLGLGRLYRRAVELPPLLDLACLPPGLHSLELNNLLLALTEPAAASPASSMADVAVAAVPPPMAGPPGLVAPGFMGLGLGLDSQGGQHLQPVAFASPSAASADDGPGVAPSPPPPPPRTLPPLPLPPPLPLSQLTSLDVEACVVRPPLLTHMARRCGSSLRSLRLVGVVGLCDEVLAESLAALIMLRSLTVSAPGNRAVSQASLVAVSSPHPPAPPPIYGGGAHPAVSPAVAASAATAAAVPWPPPLPPPPSQSQQVTPQQQQQQQRRSLLPLLRHLTWESDDLTSRGPDLAALAPLTSLRHLYLSCTDKTAERALGSLRVLQDTLPYCHVDMVWTAARPAPGDVP